MLVYGQIIQHDINAIIYYKNMKIKKRYTSALQLTANNSIISKCFN